MASFHPYRRMKQAKRTGLHRCPISRNTNGDTFSSLTCSYDKRLQTSHLAHEGAHSLYDMMRADTSLFHQLVGRAGTGHRLHSKLHHTRQGRVTLREGFQYSIAKSALGPVIFYDHKEVACLICGCIKGFLVDGLDAVGIDDTHIDALALELIVSLKCVVQGNTCRNDSHFILVRTAHNLAAANGELLIRTVDHLRLFACGTHVDDALVIGHLRHQLRCLVGIRWIDNGAAIHGAHHRQIFQRHLGRAVFTDGDASMRATETDIRPRDGGHADEVIGAAEESCEGRGKRNLAAHAHTYGCRNKLL